MPNLRSAQKILRSGKRISEFPEISLKTKQKRKTKAINKTGNKKPTTSEKVRKAWDTFMKRPAESWFQETQKEKVQRFFKAQVLYYDGMVFSFRGKRRIAAKKEKLRYEGILENLDEVLKRNPHLYRLRL